MSRWLNGETPISEGKASLIRERIRGVAEVGSRPAVFVPKVGGRVRFVVSGSEMVVVSVLKDRVGARRALCTWIGPGGRIQKYDFLLTELRPVEPSSTSGAGTRTG